MKVIDIKIKYFQAKYHKLQYLENPTLVNKYLKLSSSLKNLYIVCTCIIMDKKLGKNSDKVVCKRKQVSPKAKISILRSDLSKGETEVNII